MSACLYPRLKASTAYQNGCRCDHCRAVKSQRSGRPSRLPVPVRVVWDDDDDDGESPWGWARRVWEGWTPAERAEVAGALESLLDELRGAGDGSFARRRSEGGRRRVA